MSQLSPIYALKKHVALFDVQCAAQNGIPNACFRSFAARLQMILASSSDYGTEGLLKPQRHCDTAPAAKDGQESEYSLCGGRLSTQPVCQLQMLNQSPIMLVGSL